MSPQPYYDYCVDNGVVLYCFKSKNGGNYGK